MREQLIEDIFEARAAYAEVGNRTPRPVEVDSNVLMRLADHAAASLSDDESTALYLMGGR